MRLWLFLLFLAPSAHAKPYFRLLDLSAPKVSVGASFGVDGSAEAQSVLAVITHSTEDGCLLPTVVCEDWALLGIGIGAKAGKASLGLGPSVNVAPVAKALLLRGVNAITKEDSYPSLKGALEPAPSGVPDVTAAIGPQWVVVPSQNWKGYYQTFVGAAWKFR